MTYPRANEPPTPRRGVTYAERDAWEHGRALTADEVLWELNTKPITGLKRTPCSIDLETGDGATIAFYFAGNHRGEVHYEEWGDLP